MEWSALDAVDTNFDIGIWVASRSSWTIGTHVDLVLGSSRRAEGLVRRHHAPSANAFSQHNTGMQSQKQAGAAPAAALPAADTVEEPLQAPDVGESEDSDEDQDTPSVFRYSGNIRDADHARHSLAHPDPTEFTKLHLAKDDIQVVKGRMHLYARLLYEAITVSGNTDMTGIVKNAKSVNEERLKEIEARFVAQQETSLLEVQDLLLTEQQRKHAEANCILAWEAVVRVHETGMPTEDYEGVKAKPNLSRAKLDLTTICSERLEEMIKLTERYKLVALDVMQGRNLVKFAQHPRFYANQKLTSLRSNVRRVWTHKERVEVEKVGAEEQKMDKNGKGEGRTANKGRGTTATAVVGQEGSAVRMREHNGNQSGGGDQQSEDGHQERNDEADDVEQVTGSDVELTADDKKMFLRELKDHMDDSETSEESDGKREILEDGSCVLVSGITVSGSLHPV
ncbi:hypothetical protein LTR53_003040 [Teratosphaeriaceae sp. CCFEE 6253]|nr:hypothetical protein LTR53_003040 [Teratosphaeriaceae sp. CCFEE 6253]